MSNTGSYTDEKGRTRWHRHDELALRRQELHTFLIITDYRFLLATRYPWLAHYLSGFPESMEAVFQQGRLQEEIPGVGETMETLIGEFLMTGTSAKLEECIRDTPRTVAELVPIPGLGAKTIKRLYQEIGVESLVSLRAAIDEGRLKGFRGIGPKTLEKNRRRILTSHSSARKARACPLPQVTPRPVGRGPVPRHARRKVFHQISRLETVSAKRIDTWHMPCSQG